MRQHTFRAPRGISLIEALVAMAVMAFGMLGVVGMQATLRTNADLSKQRTEAMRIAQERMEDLRNFSVLTDPTATSKAFDTKATFAATTVTGYTTNTSYTVSGTVTPTTPSTHKTLAINVAWIDRTGATQNVSLMSALANIAPEVSASMIVSAQGAGGTREPEGRRRGIPPQAKNFGDGTSGFRPPQAVGGTVAWVFNNATGIITSVCTTSAVDSASLVIGGNTTGCDATQAYQLISGYIRVATGATAPTAASVANPTGTVPNTLQAEVNQTLPVGFAGLKSCFHEYAATYAAFYCAIPVTTPAPANWAGTLQIRPTTLPTLSANLADAVAANRKVCRNRVDATYATTQTNQPLANQNLTVISAGNGTVAFACPTPPTWNHQPAT
jgi:Tfp pilus assembly protein PilV